MNKMQLNVEDTNFILSEIKRFLDMSGEQGKAHFKEHGTDALYSVPHPSGNGMLICGWAAYDRFLAIAKRYLSGYKALERQIEVEAFRRATIHDFVNRFLKWEKDINEKNVAMMLSSALKHVQLKTLDLTHFIPCVITKDELPEFRIGPVRFRLMKDFFQEEKENFETARQRLTLEHINRCENAVTEGWPEERVATPEQSKEHVGWLVSTTTKTFSTYPWIAEVIIPGCDEETSYNRAVVTVEGALNILRLLLGESYGRKIRIGFSPDVAREAAKLIRDKAGKLEFSLSFDGCGAPFGEKWFKPIFEVDNSFLDALGSTVNGLADPSICSRLQQRFLDALMWYGQGVIETLPAAQIIKYVTALECITVSGEQGDKAETVSRRVALLCSGVDITGFEKWKKDTKEAYDFRSRLTHGDYSPLSEELDKIKSLAEKIAREALLNAVGFYQCVERKVDNASSKELDKEFQLLLGFMNKAFQCNQHGSERPSHS